MKRKFAFNIKNQSNECTKDHIEELSLDVLRKTILKGTNVTTLDWNSHQLPSGQGQCANATFTTFIRLFFVKSFSNHCKINKGHKGQEVNHLFCGWFCCFHREAQGGSRKELEIVDKFTKTHLCIYNSTKWLTRTYIS